MRVCEVFQGTPGYGLNHDVSAAVAFGRERLGITPVVKAGNTPDISSVLSARCGLIVAAGYAQSPAVFAMASRHPGQRFLIADDWFSFSSAPDLTRRNVSVLAFEAGQGSFLAGYVAAAVSPDHVVGEYGSVNTPTIDLALNGFLAGARAWGEDSGRKVRVLGWNGTRGPFVGNDLSRPGAFAITSRLIHGGAHVIFGATGDAILGSAAAAAQHRSVYVIGMYSDGYVEAPQYGRVWLTSVVFNMRGPMLTAMRPGTAGGLYVGTVSNGGVGLAPFHHLAHLVPRAIAAKLHALKAGIAAGWVSTSPLDYVPREKETGNSNG